MLEEPRGAELPVGVRPTLPEANNQFVPADLNTSKSSMLDEIEVSASASKISSLPSKSTFLPTIIFSAEFVVSNVINTFEPSDIVKAVAELSRILNSIAPPVAKSISAVLGSIINAPEPVEIVLPSITILSTFN